MTTINNNIYNINQQNSDVKADDTKDDTKEDIPIDPIMQFQGSWAVQSIKGVMDHLKKKHGKDKAVQMVKAKNYTVDDMDSPHHFEVMNIQGKDVKIIGTSYYFLAPNASSGDAISQTIYALLDDSTITGPFPGPLGTMVRVKAKYDAEENAILITYSGTQTSTVKRYFSKDGKLCEEFTVQGSIRKYKTKIYSKVSDARLVFSPSYGPATGTSSIVKNEVTIVESVQAYWLPDTLQIVGLSVYFKGDVLPITVGQTDGTETKRVELPSINVSFNIWTSTNNPLSGNVCAIQFGDATKPITKDNPIIGTLPNNPVPFLYNVPAYPLYCIGFICVFDKNNGQLNSIASLNAYEEPSISSMKIGGVTKGIVDGNERLANALSQVKDDITAKAKSHNIVVKEYKAVQVLQQLVAGMNYWVKIQIDADKYCFAKIFVSLKQIASLTQVIFGKTANDELTSF